MTICPDCLRDEFDFAPAAREQEGADAIKQDVALSYRRATARAERLSDDLQTGAAFSPHGALRFVLGVVLFFIGASIFMFGAGMEEWELRTYLPEGARRPLSILFCWVAAALVFTSSRQHRWLVYPLSLFFIVAGWFMPNFWFSMAAREKKETAAAIAASQATKEQDKAATAASASRNERVLTEEDLAIYRQKCQSEGSVVNYGIYINTRDVGLRQSIRDALSRLLVAESCVPYSCGQGSLFIVSRSAGGRRNVAHVAARFGDLNYANPSEGIYEVAFSPEKVYATSTYTTEQLASPQDPAFVAAHAAELRNLLDPHRIRTAASALAAARLEEQRDEVRRALGEVLHDPWDTEPETYRALVEALVVYAAPGDKEAVDACRKYFLFSRNTRRIPSVPVMELLIREVPAEMVSPVVELWCSNPVEWGNVLTQLGTRPQKLLLEELERTDSLQLIGSILKHLEHNGTPEAAAAVEKFVNHPDSLISRTARMTLQALGGGQH